MNVKDFFSKMNEKVSQGIMPRFSMWRRFVPFFGTLFILMLTAVMIFNVFHNKPDFLTAKITHDTRVIVNILHKIDASCGIVSFDHKRIHVDFLNVRLFSGSEVGGLNLAHPQKWQGPYLKTNPVVQGKPYEIVRAQDGFFVVPGKGVELPNKLVMGKDIKISSKISVIPMITSGGALFHKSRALAIKLPFKIGDWPNPRVEGLSKSFREFSTAMSYTQNTRKGFRPQLARPIV